MAKLEGKLEERRTEYPPMYDWLRRFACVVPCAALVACLGVRPGEIAWPGSRIWRSPPAETWSAASPGPADFPGTVAAEVERAQGRATLPERPVLAEASAPFPAAGEDGDDAPPPDPPAPGNAPGPESARGRPALDFTLDAALGPPGTAPTLQAAHEYQLYFRIGSSDLDEPSARVLHQLIGNALLIRPSRVLVVGHADRSGPADSNEELSRRRALTVVARLREAGIPQERIDVRALGERGPAVPTRDGEPSAANGRVAVRLL